MENNSEKKNEKLNLKDNNKKLLLIAMPVVIVILLVGFISISNMTDLMGNSSTNTNYKCEDSSYELKGDKCVKQVQEKAYLIGDVNKDGDINVSDISFIQKFVGEKGTLDDYQKLLGDVNKDGAVDTIDIVLLQKYVKNNTSGTLGSTNYINQMTCRDGFEFKDNYCYGTITVDAIYIENNNEQPVSSSNEKTVAYYIGDVNKDGSIDVLDVSLLEKYISNPTILDDYQKVLGDANKDGIVDTIDLSLLKKYINSPQSGTTTASSYIYRKACPNNQKLVGSNCVSN